MSTSDYPSSTTATGPTATVDPEAVARAKREIQGLVQEIAELSRSEVAPEEFYDALLNRVVTALAAPGGAVWTVAEAGGLKLAYQIAIRETGLVDKPIGQAQHSRLLHQVLHSKEGALVAPHSGHGEATDNDENAAANPTDYLLVLGPVHNDQGPQGVIEIFQRAGARSVTQRGYLRFVLQVCELAGDFLRGRRLRHLAEKQSLWEQLESFTRLAHEKLEVRQTAYTVANEGRRLIGCDRVSVAIQRGGRCPIEAVSGQDTFDKRSNVTVMLSKLARAVTRTGDAVWYEGDTSDLAPQVEKALDAYVDESHTKAMAILPLTEPRDEEEVRDEKHPPKVVGALIVEQMVDTRPPEGFKQRVEVVRSHSASALTNALEHENLFLMPVWKTLGKAIQLFRGRTLPKTLLVLALIAGVVAAGCFVPYDFSLQADGRLRPKVRSSVWATENGEITNVLVVHDQPVKKGDLLIEQESKDLEGQIEDTVGQLNAVRVAKIAALRRLKEPRQDSRQSQQEQATEIAGLRSQENTLETKLKILRLKSDKLKTYSPIDGHVITWEPEDHLLGRTVNPGEELLTIADPSGDWELEILMPEDAMRHVTEEWRNSDGDLAVTFILATHPSDRLNGKVVEIDQMAEPRGDAGNSVLIRVAFDQDELRAVVPDPKVNAGATAKIHCGDRPAGYVLLHSLFDAFKRHILFRFG